VDLVACCTVVSAASKTCAHATLAAVSHGRIERRTTADGRAADLERFDAADCDRVVVRTDADFEQLKTNTHAAAPLHSAVAQRLQ
jgi:hypothetical protein